MQPLEIEIDWKAYVAGDEREFDRVYLTFFDSLYNFGRKFTNDGEVIEDAIQELFVRFWKNRASLNEPSSLRNYLFRAFRNHLLDRLSTAGKYVLEEEAGQVFHIELESSVEQKKIDNEQKIVRDQKLEKALAKLTDRQREAVFLRFYEGFAYEEIADILGINVKGAYKLMARSISAMRESIGRGGGIFFILFKREGK